MRATACKHDAQALRWTGGEFSPETAAFRRLLRGSGVKPLVPACQESKCERVCRVLFKQIRCPVDFSDCSMEARGTANLIFFGSTTNHVIREAPVRCSESVGPTHAQ